MTTCGTESRSPVISLNDVSPRALIYNVIHSTQAYSVIAGWYSRRPTTLWHVGAIRIRLYSSDLREIEIKKSYKLAAHLLNTARWVLREKSDVFFNPSNRRATDHYRPTANGDRYTGRWWVDCYIWYNEEGPGRAAAPPSCLLAVPNVTVHPSRTLYQLHIIQCNNNNKTSICKAS